MHDIPTGKKPAKQIVFNPNSQDTTSAVHKMRAMPLSSSTSEDNSVAAKDDQNESIQSGQEATPFISIIILMLMCVRACLCG